MEFRFLPSDIWAFSVTFLSFRERWVMILVSRQLSTLTQKAVFWPSVIPSSDCERICVPKILNHFMRYKIRRKRLRISFFFEEDRKEIMPMIHVAGHVFESLSIEISEASFL